MIGHFHAKAITAMIGAELHSVFDLRGEVAEKLAVEYGGKALIRANYESAQNGGQKVYL